MKKYILTGIAAVVFTAGCAGPSNNTERGALQGGVIGGIVGGIIGHNKGGKTAEARWAARCSAEQLAMLRTKKRRTTRTTSNRILCE